MIKAVLFDFDGVLTTDATGSETICRYISGRTGISYADLVTAYRRYNKDLLCGKVSHEDIWEALCNQLNIKISMDLLYGSFENTPIDYDMVDLAYKLKAKGYKTGMVTDNKADRIEHIVSHRKWHNLFDVITVSAHVGSGKNNPDIFLKTLRDLALSAEECVFIDNNEKNLVVPSGLEMATLYFNDEQRDIAALTEGLKKLGIEIECLKETRE